MAPLWKTLVKLQNPFMVRLLRSNYHHSVSGKYLLITLMGRKSGKVYTIPVQYGQNGDTLLVVTSQEYVWWRNLKGGADVEIYLRGQSYSAYAETSTDPADIAHGLKQVYPQMTAEQIEPFTSGKVALTIHLNTNAELTPAR